MNEVHVTTAKVVLISYQRCSCCVNHASVFLKSELKIKRLWAFFWAFFYKNLCYIQNLKTPYFP